MTLNPGQHHNLTDTELLLALSEGSVASFEALYNRYQPRITQYVLPFVKADQNKASAIVQDVFVKLWVKRETLAPIVQLEFYLYRMARNRLLDLHRAQKKRRKIELLSSDTDSMNAPEELIYREYQDAARRAIVSLPQRRRTIFELFTQHDMSIDEISNSLNLSTPVIKKQLSLANRHIREYIQRFGQLSVLFLLGSKIF